MIPALRFWTRFEHSYLTFGLGGDEAVGVAVAAAVVRTVVAAAHVGRSPH